MSALGAYVIFNWNLRAATHLFEAGNLLHFHHFQPHIFKKEDQFVDERTLHPHVHTSWNVGGGFEIKDKLM